jgi:predicted Rossmann fold nucleotide-binding protein DprA/Smf involved in DNA uptake
LDQLVTATGWKVAETSVILLELQLKGFVQTDTAQRYVQI